ncbi:hypothetical protein J4466_05220 [Candidatus Pacearchaeota archaeon]|nr:hypothetical protein [Candidatus Pacearchaeota archaeon]
MDPRDYYKGTACILSDSYEPLKTEDTNSKEDDFMTTEQEADYVHDILVVLE